MNTKLRSQDQDFLKLLFGKGKIIHKLEIFGVFKGNDLLVALPLKKDYALKSLALYQPQSFKAKLITTAVKCSVKLGFRWFQKKITLEIRETSPLLAISAFERFGFLLGNPKSVARRMICYYHNDGKDYVSKIGVEGIAKISVANEFEVLNTIVADLECAPDLISHSIKEDHAQYTTEWMQGKSPQVDQEPLLLELLLSWQKDKILTNLQQNRLFKNTLKKTSDDSIKDYFNKLESFPLFSSIVHGDFTSWNIKINSESKIKVLDWEHCATDGIAGWDIAHYYTQSKYLVKKMHPEEVVDCLLYWAKNEQGNNYLMQAGWGDHHEAWLGSYLIIGKYHLGYELDDLIECWKCKVGIVHCNV